MICCRYGGILFGLSNTAATIPGMVAPYIAAALTPNVRKPFLLEREREGGAKGGRGGRGGGGGVPRHKSWKHFMAMVGSESSICEKNVKHYVMMLACNWCLPEHTLLKQKIWIHPQSFYLPNNIVI